jgi:hypothetical protein
MSLSFFYNHNLNEFAKLHDQVYQHQSKASKAIFKSTLVRIQKLYGEPLEKLDMVYAQDVSKFYDLLNTTKYSENTKLQTVSVVIKLLRCIDAPLSLINQYINFHKKKSHENQEIKKLEIQKENSIVPNFEDLQDNFIGIMDYYLEPDRTYNDFLKYLILGIFLLQPPLRSTNYLNCKLVIRKDVPEDTTHNYLMLDTLARGLGSPSVAKGLESATNMCNGQFTFVYNTLRKGSLLPQRLNPVVSPELTKLLNHYIEKFYIDNGNRWFLKNFNGREIYNRVIENTIKEMSVLLLDRELTIDDLRASYMKHIYHNERDLLNNIEVIQLLGIQNIPNYLK